MATLAEVQNLFVGRTVTAVDVRSCPEGGDAVQLSSLTFDDGTIVHLSGEHDCAYIDGLIQDGKYIDPPTLEEEEAGEEEDEWEEPEDTRQTLRETMPPELAKRLVGSEFEELLDYPANSGFETWPARALEARNISQFWVVDVPGPGGRQAALGLHKNPWDSREEILLARTHMGIDFWVPCFDVAL